MIKLFFILGLLLPFASCKYDFDLETYSIRANRTWYSGYLMLSTFPTGNCKGAKQFTLNPLNKCTYYQAGVYRKYVQLNSLESVNYVDQSTVEYSDIHTFSVIELYYSDGDCLTVLSGTTAYLSSSCTSDPDIPTSLSTQYSYSVDMPQISFDGYTMRYKCV